MHRCCRLQSTADVSAGCRHLFKHPPPPQCSTSWACRACAPRAPRPRPAAPSGVAPTPTCGAASPPTASGQGWRLLTGARQTAAGGAAPLPPRLAAPRAVPGAARRRSAVHHLCWSTMAADSRSATGLRALRVQQPHQAGAAAVGRSPGGGRQWRRRWQPRIHLSGWLGSLLLSPAAARYAVRRLGGSREGEPSVTWRRGAAGRRTSRLMEIGGVDAATRGSRAAAVDCDCKACGSVGRAWTRGSWACGCGKMRQSRAGEG